MDIASSIETTGQDLRYALRGFRRSPGFALTAILSLALGIGASVSIFTVADSLLLRPLPYRDPSRLVMLWEANRQRGVEHQVASPGNYLDWKAQNDHGHSAQTRPRLRRRGQHAILTVSVHRQ